MSDYIPASAKGEACSVCGAPAARKVEETIFSDDPSTRELYGLPIQARHPFTAYLCMEHFVMVMGPAARAWPPQGCQHEWSRELSTAGYLCVKCGAVRGES